MGRKRRSSGTSSAASFGGPIVRNRAFFFVDYEGFRQDRSVTQFSTIPTPDQKRGVLGVAVVDPRTGTTYPACTALPMTAFARKVLSDLPDPNLPGTVGPVSRRTTTPFRRP